MLITVPKALRERLGKEASEGLIELLNSQSQNSNNSITTFVEEKFERRLSEEMALIFSLICGTAMEESLV
jgi:hypothetical protein